MKDNILITLSRSFAVDVVNKYITDLEYNDLFSKNSKIRAILIASINTAKESQIN